MPNDSSTPPLLEAVDLENSAQNAFVQSWLSEFNERFNTGKPPESSQWLDHLHVESTIEQLQEIYDYTDHEARRR